MHVQTLSKTPTPGKSRNLPNRILRAFDNAKHIIGLPRGVKDTLAELCRFVKQNDPFVTIFATKKTIGERIGAHERTVHRHIAYLIQKGLVEVLAQERKSHNGKFAVSRIKLTKNAAELLGLIQPISQIENTVPHDKIADGHTLTEPTNSNNQPPTSINGLPADLSHLTGQGLQREGVFKLMGMATAKQQRLSDIVTVERHKLQNMRGGGLFGYLSKLINGEKDYAYTARLLRESMAKKELEAATEKQLRHVREALKSKTFTNVGQNVIYMIDRKAEFVQIVSAKRSATAPICDLIEWQNRLAAGELIMSTPELEALVMKNIDRIKTYNREQTRKQTFERFYGKTMSTGDNLSKENTKNILPSHEFVIAVKSRSEQQVEEAIEKMPKGRAWNVSTMLAMLKNKAQPLQSTAEPFFPRSV
jgi:hypothetical protein